MAPQLRINVKVSNCNYIQVFTAKLNIWSSFVVFLRIDFKTSTVEELRMFKKLHRSSVFLKRVYCRKAFFETKNTTKMDNKCNSLGRVHYHFAIKTFFKNFKKCRVLFILLNLE